jgi:uncharacterized cofD-like protein
LVPDIAAAIRSSQALKIYICNVATQPGETDEYTCGDHIAVLEDHVEGELFDIVVSNHRCEGSLPEHVTWVQAEEELDERYAVYRSDVVDTDRPWRHDAQKLAKIIMNLYLERTGPLVE